MQIKKGNQVKIITGKDKGKTGEVIEIKRKMNTIKVNSSWQDLTFLVSVASSPNPIFRTTLFIFGT